MNTSTQHTAANASPPRRATGRLTTAGLPLAGLTATALAAAAGPVAARGSTDSLTTTKGSAHLGANVLGTAENVRWFSQLG